MKINDRVTLQIGEPKEGVNYPTLFITFTDDIADKLIKHGFRALHVDDFAVWNVVDHLTTASQKMQEALYHDGR